MTRASIIMAACALCAACGSDDAATGDVDVTSTPDVAGDADAAVTPPRWQLHTVGQGDDGRQIQVANLADGTPVVVHYSDRGVMGDLCDPMSANSGARITWPLWLTTYAGAQSTTERVADIVHLGATRGVDLAVAPDGRVQVAALTGEPVPSSPPYCGAHDLALYTRDAPGSWSLEVAVAESGEASTGNAGSDAGNVVGLWPALAYEPGGQPVIAYKDVHFGSLQADDFRRADLELASRAGGSWAASAVDWGEGAGNFTTLAYDDQGRPVILYYNPRDDLGAASMRGIWVARSDDGGSTWQRVRLHQGGTSERPSMAVADNGTVTVAWYDPEDGLPWLAELTDPTKFEDLSGGWTRAEFGDHVYDEGYHPSVAISASGFVGVAYRRCGRAVDGLGGCAPTNDAVVFAWRDAGVWEREVVDAGGIGSCGDFPSLAFDGDRPVVFYQCQRQPSAGAPLEAALMAAQGPRL